MSEKVFPEGIFVGAPHENAPDFVKAKVSINLPKAGPWLKANVNERGYINLDLKLSQGGKLYLELDNWQPGTDANGSPTTPADDFKPDDKIPW